MACGYRAVNRCVTRAELGDAVARSLSTEEGPHFLLCKVSECRSQAHSLPRVTSRHTPEENKQAFQIAPSISRGLFGSTLRQREWAGEASGGQYAGRLPLPLWFVVVIWGTNWLALKKTSCRIFAAAVFHRRLFARRRHQDRCRPRCASEARSSAVVKEGQACRSGSPSNGRRPLAGPGRLAVSRCRHQRRDFLYDALVARHDRMDRRSPNAVARRCYRTELRHAAVSGCWCRVRLRWRHLMASWASRCFRWRFSPGRCEHGPVNASPATSTCGSAWSFSWRRQGELSSLRRCCWNVGLTGPSCRYLHGLSHST